jgi:hypothetical protein
MVEAARTQRILKTAIKHPLYPLGAYQVHNWSNRPNTAKQPTRDPQAHGVSDMLTRLCCLQIYSRFQPSHRHIPENLGERSPSAQQSTLPPHTHGAI